MRQGRFQAKARQRRKLERRLKPEERPDRWNSPDGRRPVFRTSSATYEVSDRIDAANARGIGAARMPAKKARLAEAIGAVLHLLRIRAPCDESDLVLPAELGLEGLGLRREVKTPVG